MSSVAGEPFGPRIRVGLAVGLAALGFGLVAARSELRGARAAGASSALVAATLGLAALPWVVPVPPPPLHEALQRVVALLACWSGFLALLAFRGGDRPPAAHVPDVRARRGRGAALVLSLLGGFAMAATHVLLKGDWASVVDEVLYVLQARTLAEPAFGRAVSPELLDFFVLPQSFYREGRLYGQYPPGWPAILAAGDAIGLGRWTNVTLGAATIWLTFALGRRVSSTRTAMLGAALLATSYLFVRAGGDWFAHTSASAALVGAALLLRPGAEHERPGRRIAALLASGALFGVAVAVRPITGAAVGLSIVLWTTIHAGPSPRALAITLVALALGSVPAVAGVLHYNGVTTGSPFSFGYESANGSHVAFGFGDRGIVAYDQTGRPFAALADFTPAIAAGNAVTQLWNVLVELGPGLLVAAILAAWLLEDRDASGVRRRWLAAACVFLVLPLAQLGFYHADVRFYTELLPFAALGVAAVVVRLAATAPAMGRAAAVLLLATLALAGAARLHGESRSAHGRLAIFGRLEALRRQDGRVVVFVRDPVPQQSLLSALWWFNLPELPGDLVVARDLGDRNAELRARLPGHAPYLLVRTGASAATLERLP